MFIPDPKFYLKDRNATDPTLIYMQAKYSADNSQRFMLSTGNKILPNEWDDSKQRAIITKKTLFNSDLNLWLDKMSNAFKTAFRGSLLDGKIPNALELKDKVEESLNIKTCVQAPISQQKTFCSFIKSFISDSSGSRALNTIKSYNSTLNRIKQYGVLCSKEFDFDDIDLEWRANFIKFLQTLGAGRNTEGKHIKNVKVFLNEATERGINKNMAFKSKSFRIPIEQVHKIFLPTNEIQLIADLDLSNDRLKDVVRDYFILACYSALRFSDLTSIRKENIKDDKIQIITAKTGQEVVIPISPMVRSIFEKYNYNLPKSPCNQVFNRYLKEIGKSAGLTEQVAITKTVGGIKKTIIKQKWELLSSHVGRRSLVSNCMLGGINTSSIMLISGHKSLNVFQGYVRVNQQQNAEVLSKHSFFQN